MNDNINIIKTLILTLCGGLVSNPKKLKVHAVETDSGGRVIAEITCADDDFAKILGAAKANLLAIQRVIASAANHMHTNVDVSLVSPEDNQRHDQAPFRYNSKWKHDIMLHDINTVCAAAFAHVPEVKVVDMFKTTVFSIALHPMESSVYKGNLLYDTKNAIKRIFRAQGKNQGRNVDVLFD